MIIPQYDIGELDFLQTITQCLALIINKKEFQKSHFSEH
ncbi:hypothetical protein CSB66_0160 [Enterobacter hormaechei]|nr:hypothetical protein CSC19_2172 [Enterobacter hormaechei]RAL74298.1 hypothetical protein CSC35_2823 [Enterobacter hormaechei]RCG79386.1 hypothetical protein CSB66_0160 [Enterobacter hormaechei]